MKLLSVETGHAPSLRIIEEKHVETRHGTSLQRKTLLNR